MKRCDCPEAEGSRMVRFKVALPVSVLLFLLGSGAGVVGTSRLAGHESAVPIVRMDEYAKKSDLDIAVVRIEKSLTLVERSVAEMTRITDGFIRATEMLTESTHRLDKTLEVLRTRVGAIERLHNLGPNESREEKP